jgi:hypothetical protein
MGNAMPEPDTDQPEDQDERPLIKPDGTVMVISSGTPGAYRPLNLAEEFRKAQEAGAQPQDQTTGDVLPDSDTSKQDSETPADVTVVDEAHRQTKKPKKRS